MLLIAVDKKSKESLQQQIVSKILGHIENGVLKPNSKLPSSRMLAAELKLSRNTVMNAYQRLISEGYIETVAATGTRVCSILPKDLVAIEPEERISQDSGDEGMHRHAPVVFSGQIQEIVNRNRQRIECDFWVGRPHKKLFPSKIWQHLLLDCISFSSSQIVQYGEPAGFMPLREAIAEHVSYTRAIPASADQILITVGIQEALNIIARLFVTEGAPVLLENPCYQGAAFVFKSYGAELCPAPVDEEGVVVDALPERKGNIIYVTPSHQYPLGVTMSMSRRKQLIEWAERTGSYIIEDDYDGDFRYESPPLPSISSLSTHGHVIYMGTFSKSVAAGLRIGYMVLPKQLIAPAVGVKTLLNNHNSWLDQAVMAKFLQEGHFERHLLRIRTDYQLRRDTLIKEMKHCLGDVELCGVDGGMHLSWKMPPGLIEASDLQKKALSRGVGIYTLNSGGSIEIGPVEDASRRIILGYSSLDVDDIKNGIQTISSVLREPWE